MTGIMIFLIYSILMAAAIVFLYRRNSRSESIDSFFFAGRNVGGWLLTPGVFNAWLWTTTIIGAAEAGARYGVSGLWSYALGAGLAFALMTAFMVYFRHWSGGMRFLPEFISRRFSKKTGLLYMTLSIMIVMYIIVEMAAGVGFSFNGLFGISYKTITFMSVIVATCFVVFTGIKGNLASDVIHMAVIIISFAVLAWVILHRFDPHLLYQGLLDVKTDAANVNHNPDILNIIVAAGGRYFVSALIVGFAQTLLDPTYYLKSWIAKSDRTFIRSFLVGGVAMFIPCACLSTIMFGFTALYLGYDLSSVNASIVLSSKMLIEHFGLCMQVMMGVFMLAVGTTTMINGLMGIMALSGTQLYHKVTGIDPAPTYGVREGHAKDGTGNIETDKKAISFARIFTLLIGSICGFVAISLQNISLLKMDTFCGIVFAAAAAAVLAGVISDNKLGGSAIPAIAAGVVTGFIVWIQVGNRTEAAWMWACLTSFFISMLIVMLTGLIRGKELRPQ